MTDYFHRPRRGDVLNKGGKGKPYTCSCETYLKGAGAVGS